MGWKKRKNIASAEQVSSRDNEMLENKNCLLNDNDLFELLDRLPLKELLAFKQTGKTMARLVKFVLKRKKHLTVTLPKKWAFEYEVLIGVRQLLLQCQEIRRLILRDEYNIQPFSLNLLLRNELFGMEFATCCPYIEDFGFRFGSDFCEIANYCSSFDKGCRIKKLVLSTANESHVIWESCSQVEDVHFIVDTNNSKKLNRLWDEAKLSKLKKISITVRWLFGLKPVCAKLASLLNRSPSIQTTLRISQEDIYEGPVDEDVLTSLRLFCRTYTGVKIKLRVCQNDMEQISGSLSPLVSSLRVGLGNRVKCFIFVDDLWTKLFKLVIHSDGEIFAHLTNHFPPNLKELHWAINSNTPVKDFTEFNRFAVKHGPKFTALSMTFSGVRLSVAMRAMAKFVNLKNLCLCITSLKLTDELRSFAKQILNELSLPHIRLNNEKITAEKNYLTKSPLKLMAKDAESSELLESLDLEY